MSGIFSYLWDFKFRIIYKPSQRLGHRNKQCHRKRIPLNASPRLLCFCLGHPRLKPGVFTRYQLSELSPTFSYRFSIIIGEVFIGEAERVEIAGEGPFVFGVAAEGDVLDGLDEELDVFFTD